MKCSCASRYRKEITFANGTEDNFYTSKAWRTLRSLKIQEYSGYCQRCWIKNQIITSDNLEGHHIIARSVNKELELEPDNIVIVCKTCNLQLGTSGVDWDRSKEVRQEIAHFL